MKSFFPFTKPPCAFSQFVVPIKHSKSMAIITMIMVTVLVVALVISFTVEKQKHYEAKDCDFSAGKESTINVPEPDLDLEVDQPSFESGILETQNQLNLPSAVQSELPQNLEELAKTTTAHQSPMTLLRSLSFQIAPLMQQSLRTESEAQILKNGLKIACIVISVTTSGIISFLIGFSGSNNNDQSATRINNNKLLFKAVILSMCASLFSALILLLISTIKLNFSWLILTVRIIIWISTGLLTLGVILLIAFCFHVA